MHGQKNIKLWKPCIWQYIISLHKFKPSYAHSIDTVCW